MLTLCYKNMLTYKYGCSDSRVHNLGGMPFLFWVTIQDGKRVGALELDLGRSDTDNPGLINFKDHLGANSFALNHYRYAGRTREGGPVGRNGLPLRIPWGMLPDSLLATAGRFLYKHIG